MTINFVLQRNGTLQDPHLCTAQVRPVNSADMDAVVNFMMETATVAKPDVLGVLEGFFNAVEYLLLDGKNVVTPIAVFRTAIQGLFADEQDGYDPSRHAVHAAVAPGGRLRRAMRLHAQVNKVHGVAPAPAPKRYCDVESGEDNGTVTPGGQGRVLGLRLAHDPADPLQGVFFVAADGTETRVSKPARNMPGEVIFVVPALAAGSYTLEVRTILNDNGELRTGQLQDPLTVA